MGIIKKNTNGAGWGLFKIISVKLTDLHNNYNFNKK